MLRTPDLHLPESGQSGWNNFPAPTPLRTREIPRQLRYRENKRQRDVWGQRGGTASTRSDQLTAPAMSPRLLLPLLLAATAALCWGESTKGWDAGTGGDTGGVAVQGPAARLSHPPRLRCAAGRRAALPLRASRSRAHPATALGPGGAHSRGTALRRTRSHVSSPCP